MNKHAGVHSSWYLIPKREGLGYQDQKGEKSTVPLVQYFMIHKADRDVRMAVHFEEH